MPWHSDPSLTMMDELGTDLNSRASAGYFEKIGCGWSTCAIRDSRGMKDRSHSGGFSGIIIISRPWFELLALPRLRTDVCGSFELIAVARLTKVALWLPSRFTRVRDRGVRRSVSAISKIHC